MEKVGRYDTFYWAQIKTLFTGFQHSFNREQDKAPSHPHKGSFHAHVKMNIRRIKAFPQNDFDNKRSEVWRKYWALLFWRMVKSQLAVRKEQRYRLAELGKVC